MTRDELNEVAVNQYGITNAADMSRSQLEKNIKDIDEQSDPGVAALKAEQADDKKKASPQRPTRRKGRSGKKRRKPSKG